MSKQIPLMGNRGKDNFAVVDDVDFDALKNYRWSLTKAGYVTRYAGGGRSAQAYVYMHRQIMDFPDGNIDHKDGDPLNNCRSNLRVVNQSQNNQNARPRANGTSQYKGVYWVIGKQRWAAVIHVDKQKVFLGYYTTEQVAAEAYNKAATHYFGQYARLNTIAPDHVLQASMR